jgi:hypothetical protein
LVFVNDQKIRDPRTVTKTKAIKNFKDKILHKKWHYVFMNKKMKYYPKNHEKCRFAVGVGARVVCLIVPCHICALPFPAMATIK